MKKTYLLNWIILLFVIGPIAGNAQSSIEKNLNGDLSIQIDKKDASGDNSNDGFIKLVISGSTGPYTIHCFSPYSLPSKTIGTELKLENIKPGDYLFIIQDINGKSTIKEVNVSNHR